MQQKQIVKTNYFPIQFNSPIFKYKVETFPEIPSNKLNLLYRLFSNLREKLSEHLSPYQPINFMVYSLKESELLSFITIFENIEYAISVVPAGLLLITEEEKESLNFMGRLYKLFQGKLNLQPVGRKYFDANASKGFPQHKLSVWPGYQTSLNSHKNKLFVTIDVCFKVIRETRVYDYIQDLMGKCRGNREQVVEQLKGTTIMTQ